MVIKSFRQINAIIRKSLLGGKIYPDEIEWSLFFISHNPTDELTGVYLRFLLDKDHQRGYVKKTQADQIRQIIGL